LFFPLISMSEASPDVPRERLPEAECHVWVVPVEEALGAAADRYLPWLSAEEVQRVKRYHFERHRREHLATRVLARSALSRYTGIAPERWVFGAGSHGKPHLVSPPAPLGFNLANTEGVVACAVAAGGNVEVGVDVEPDTSRVDPLELAEAAFSPEEVDLMRATPPGDRRARFITLWTLKEAYVKARGLGLALPTTRFTVDLDGGSGATLRFDPAIADQPARWQLARLTSFPGYQLAVALSRQGGADRRIVLRPSATLDVHLA
jgi:4'-phosphopantetheinyl transferase